MSSKKRSTSKFICFVLTLLLLIVYYKDSEALIITGDSAVWHRTNAGEISKGAIQVYNEKESPESIRIYTTDYLYQADGSSLFENAAGHNRSNQAWITLDHKQIDIPAKSSATVRYTLHTPDSPDIQGSYWSMIMIEPISPELLQPPSEETGELRMAIKHITRFAIQIISNVGNTTIVDLEFKDFQLGKTENNDEITIDIEIAGKGERITRTDLWVEIYDQNQGLVGKYSSDPFGLHPGCSRMARINIPSLTEGTYQALIVADCGEDDVFGVQTELVIQ